MLIGVCGELWCSGTCKPVLALKELMVRLVGKGQIRYANSKCLRHGLQEVDRVQRGRWEKIFFQRIDCVYKHETEYGFRSQLNTPLGGASLGCPPPPSSFPDPLTQLYISPHFLPLIFCHIICLRVVFICCLFPLSRMDRCSFVSLRPLPQHTQHTPGWRHPEQPLGCSKG